MSRKIENVFVNGISLVSKEHTPAVEQAETGFALFKTVNKSQKQDLQKIQSDLQKMQLNLQKSSFSEIQSNLKKSFLGT